MLRIVQESFTPQACVDLRFDVEDAPLTEVNQMWMIRPSQVWLTYKYIRIATEDGWLSHRWVCESVNVRGPMVIESVWGERRSLGQDIESVFWQQVGGEGLTPVGPQGELPQWLAELVEHMRPAGEVSMPFRPM